MLRFQRETIALPVKAAARYICRNPVLMDGILSKGQD
jgi:hypothetical protein